MSEIAETINFKDICIMLDKIKSTKKLEKKKKYIQRYYESFKNHRTNFLQRKGLSDNFKEDGRSSFYCVLRCLVPSADTERSAYNLQITSISQVYIKVLKLSKDSQEACRLKEARSFGREYDYPDIINKILKTRCRNEASTLKLHCIHQMLDTIASENIRNTEKILTQLYETANAREQTWFIRLLLKNMNLGIGEQGIFNIVHPQAREMYQRCTNLKRVCCMLADNSSLQSSNIDIEKKIKTEYDLSSAIQPFHHVQPMLCEIFPGNIEPLMADDVLNMETKQDGERFQLHYASGRFQYYSRNGIDYTSSFGADYSSGSLTPLLQSLLPIGMVSIILDGEMMIWDTEDQSYREKSENTDVKHLSNRENWRPCFIVYDLLFLNGRSLLDVPYVRRTHKMRECLREQVGVLQTMKPIKIISPEDFKEKYQQALDSNAEGVVVKKQKSIYRPGIRHGGGWYKVKADYIDGLTSDFDLLIMGGFYNRSRNFIESFLVGVLKYNSAESFKIYSVGKVSNNSRRRRVLNNTLRLHWKEFKSEPPPAWYHCALNSSEGQPHVWIEPQNSTILQIKATDLVQSSNFPLLKSLHFARTISWRNDKIWYECTSLIEYLQLCQQNNKIKKINKRELRIEDIMTDRKKLRISTAQRRKLCYLAFERKFDSSKTQLKSALLSGFSFCILSGDIRNSYPLQRLKELVVQNGGEIIENPLPNDPKCILLAGEITYRVKTFIRSGQMEILSVCWLLKTCKRQFMQLIPHDFVYHTEEMRQQFEEFCDKYGDSFTQNVDCMDLKDILQKVHADEMINEFSDEEEVESLTQAILKETNVNFLHNLCAHFYNCDESFRIIFEFRGGSFLGNNKIAEKQTFSEKTLNTLFYIFIDPLITNKIELQLWLEVTFTQPQISFMKVIDANWIMESHIAAKPLEIDKFIYFS